MHFAPRLAIDYFIAFVDDVENFFAHDIEDSSSLKQTIQLNERFQTDRFGPDLWRELQSFKCSLEFLSGPILLQQFHHHFAPLRKRLLYEAIEILFLIGCD